MIEIPKGSHNKKRFSQTKKFSEKKRYSQMISNKNTLREKPYFPGPGIS